MAVITFPSSPSLDETFTVGNKTWKWNGYAWDLQLQSAASDEFAFAQANTALDVGTSAGIYANGAFTKANGSLQLSGGYVTGTVTANNLTANLTVHTPVIYSLGGGASIELSDIGIIAINPSGGSGAGPKFTGKSIEVNSVYGGSYGGNYLSLDNDTKLGSNRYDSVKIITSTSGEETNTWNFANNQVIFPDGTYQNTAWTGKDDYARITANAAYDLSNVHTGEIAAGMNYVNAAFLLANTVYLNADNASNYANGAFAAANVADIKAISSGDYANAAFIRANNSLDANNGGLINAPITVNGNISVGGNISLYGSETSKISSNNFTIETKSNTYTFKEDGTVAFPQYTFPAQAGNTSQVMVYDGAGNLIWTDLTANTTTYTANSVALTNGVYVSGSVTDIQTYGDYITGGYYNFTDGTGSGPAWILDVDFLGVVDFNRVILNINYTQNSGHTIYVQLYNTNSSTWDSIGSYNGLSGYYQFALAVIESTNYVSGGTVLLRLYHNNAGNALHETRVDYIALEKSTQGPQGPKGLTGATGPEGNANTANAAFAHANAAFESANSKLTASGDGTFTGNLTVTGDLSVGGNVVYTGNVTSVTITGNTGQFFGDTYGFGALYAGIATGYVVQPQTVFQSASDFDGTSQINNQNINNGVDASTDFVATADNGSNEDTYIDMGINSSTYYNAEYGLTHPNDGYVYVRGNTITGGGNLILATMTTNDIVFAVQGQTHDNEVMRISYANTVIIRSTVASTDTTSGALQVAGGVGVQGSIYAGAVYSGGNEVLTTSSPVVASSYNHANSAFDKANTVSDHATAAYNSGNTTLTYAEAGFAHANAAFVAANNATDTYVRNHANSAYIQANAAYDHANTAIADSASASSYANSAFFKANTAHLDADGASNYANGAFDKANTAVLNAASASSYANSAFEQANADYTLVISAYNHANAAFAVANTGGGGGGGGGTVTVSATPPTTANANGDIWISSTSLREFIYFNDGDSAQWVEFNGPGAKGDPGNPVYANAAFDKANAAYDAANTKVSSGQATISQLTITSNTQSFGSFSERTKIYLTPLTAETDVDLGEGVAHYFTANSAANANINLIGFSSLAAGNTISMAVMVTNNTLPKMINTVKIDGTYNNVSTKWAGGTAPYNAAQANTDIYSFSVVKVAEPNTFIVFASKSQFGG